MKRRDFIALIGTAIAWPAKASAQPARIRHVAIFWGGRDDPEIRRRISAFIQALEQLGWVEQKNLKISFRWGADPAYTEAQAREVARLEPDVILCGPSNALVPLQRATETIPIVFVNVSDPLGQGIVQSLSRPTGNATGFTNLEFSLVGKWLQILKQAVPSLKRVGLMIYVLNASSPRWYQTFNEVAPTVGIEPISVPIKEQRDIEPIIVSLAKKPNTAVLLAGDTLVERPQIRQEIVRLVSHHKLPALYGVLSFIREGGFLVYGTDPVEPYRRAAGYVDRILKGQRPSELPVQQPTKFHFAINLNRAKELDLDISSNLVSTADEVIE